MSPLSKSIIKEETEGNVELKEELNEIRKEVEEEIRAEYEEKYQNVKKKYYKKTSPLSPEEQARRDAIRDREPVEFADDLNSLTDFLEKYGSEEDEVLPVIDYNEAWFMFNKERPTARGDGKSTKIQFTIRRSTNRVWREFVRDFAGTPVTKGRGISSAIAELALLVFVGVIAEFKLSETGYKLNNILNSSLAKERVRANLLKLANSIEIES